MNAFLVFINWLYWWSQRLWSIKGFFTKIQLEDSQKLAWSEAKQPTNASIYSHAALSLQNWRSFMEKILAGFLQTQLPKNTVF